MEAEAFRGEETDYHPRDDRGVGCRSGGPGSCRIRLGVLEEEAMSPWAGGLGGWMRGSKVEAITAQRSEVWVHHGHGIVGDLPVVGVAQGPVRVALESLLENDDFACSQIEEIVPRQLKPGY